MLTPDLFEKLLATYPAEKRELARQVVYRFADGDNTQFFTQLFLLLDVYAHYAERVPKAVLEATEKADRQWKETRDRIAELSNEIDRRSVAIANHAEKTQELCQRAVARCGETIVRVDGLPHDLASRVDVKAIVAAVRADLEKTIQSDVTQPFIKQTKALEREVLPTLEQVRKCSDAARELWGKQIWTTAWLTTLLSGALIVVVIWMRMESAYRRSTDRAAAAEIARVGDVMNVNREAFEELGVAGVTVQILPTSDKDGKIELGRFALIMDAATGAEMRPMKQGSSGLLFFRSAIPVQKAYRVKRALPPPPPLPKSEGK